MKDFFVAFILIALMAFSWHLLYRSKLKTQNLYLDDPASKNSTCVTYLNRIKSDAFVSYYALATASIATFILFLAFKLAITNQLNLVYLLTVVAFLATYSASYKIYNCFLFRSFCDGNYCEVKT